MKLDKWKVDTNGTHGNRVIELNISPEIAIHPEGYRWKERNQHLFIEASTEIGAFHGINDLAEYIEMGNRISGMTEFLHEPDFDVRAIKFNLPWSAYRESQSMDYHLETCRQIPFWESFLDMMLKNRFNTLLLYNKHPFPFMIRLDEYPEACSLSSDELEEWTLFWKRLFRMAKDRGIDVFIVNWNIVLPESFARHHKVSIYNDTSSISVDYTRACVTKLINTYPDLAGIGVTLADWMQGMSPEQKEKWIEKTFIRGIKEADRQVKFLHRAVLSGSSKAMRDLLNRSSLKYPSLVEVKFNWSHGHSTPKLMITHASEGGEVNTGFWDPLPTNYQIQWMIRNEDFFILRWGDPDFVRNHIKKNTAEFVNGYHIGSEGYIPAFDYVSKERNHKEWTYAFQRQWLYYAVWGKLLYNEKCADTVFEQMFNQKYSAPIGPKMLDAFKLASQMTTKLGSFFKSTWDYTLYSEGFLAPMLQNKYGLNDGNSPFISLDELIDHEVLDTSYLSIKSFVTLFTSGRRNFGFIITPEILALQLLDDSEKLGNLTNELSYFTVQNPISYKQELADLKIWELLIRYWGLKLKAGIATEKYRRTRSEKELNNSLYFLDQCVDLWEKMAQIGKRHYRSAPYWESRVFGFKNSDTNYFSWGKYLPEVVRDLKLASKLPNSTSK